MVQVKLLDLLQPPLEIVALLVPEGHHHAGKAKGNEQETPSLGPVQPILIDRICLRCLVELIVIETSRKGEKYTGCMQAKCIFVDLNKLCFLRGQLIFLLPQHVVSRVEVVLDRVNEKPANLQIDLPNFIHIFINFNH